MFEGQLLSTDSHNLKLAKHVIGMAAFIRWVNSFPESNISMGGHGDRLLSPFMAGFFSLSKSDKDNVLFLGVQYEESKWMKMLPWYAACIDKERKVLGLLCDGVSLGHKRIDPINVLIPIESDWKLEQLVQLRTLCMVGVAVENSQVTQVFDQSQRPIKLLHQPIGNAKRAHMIEQRKSDDGMSGLFE
ncbi:hypothetical protein L1281_001766 [Neisseria sp. HSC-16F19]|nr:hypothetical protein [Neisseria sp. HSC-16F19]MCP2041172.1 hypothetical protein [Neisseria sp. HSC-16F19]